MLKFELLSVQDVKLAAAIERRRRNEEERKKRIFNAKNRIIGVNPNDLDKQVKEKRDREQQEKKIEQMFAEKQLSDAVIAMECEKEENDKRKQIQHEINVFRQNYQKKEDTREYDLNDPKVLAKSLPMRLNDDDPRCGISSAQKFEGEDLASEARKKIQLEQTKSWLEQQVQERKQAEHDLKSAEVAYQEAVIVRDERAKELDKLEKQCRQELLLSVQTFNKSMMDQQQITKDIKQKEELEDNFAEMYNAVTGDFLNGDPSSAQSNFGPNRLIGYGFRGLTPAMRDAVRKEQLSQIEDKKRQKLEQQTLTKYWDDYTTQNGIVVARLDAEMKAKQRELRRREAEYNISLAKEQKAYREYLDRSVFTNQLSKDFFDQFNTSSR